MTIQDISTPNMLITQTNVAINVTVAHINTGTTIKDTYVVELLIDSVSHANISVDADLYQNSTNVFFHNINLTIPGAHTIQAFVDKDNLVNEDNNGNNNLTETWTWILNPDIKPDLILTTFAIPNPALTNIVVIMNMTISNQGKWTTQSSSNVEIFLNSISKWNITIPILQIVDSFSFSINITFQEADNYTLIIKIDSLSEISELDEFNNFHIKNIEIIFPSLENPEFWNPTTTTVVIILGSGIAVAASIFVIMLISRTKLPTYNYFHKQR